MRTERCARLERWLAAGIFAGAAGMPAPAPPNRSFNIKSFLLEAL